MSAPRHTRPRPVPKDNELICGVNPVLEALRSGRHVERLLVRRDAGGDALREVKLLAYSREVPWQPVPLEKLDRMTHTEHQGVIALMSPVEEQDLNEVIDRIYAKGEIPLLVALDGVTDVRNMGAIARSAECFGAHALVVAKHASARLGSDAVKSSAGALLRLPVCRVMDLQATIGSVQEHGLRVAAFSEKATVDVTGADLSGPLMLVLGDEGEGISPPVLRLADLLVRIPMSGKLSSLNVSVAAGIALYTTALRRNA
ncbi:MAG: 23S rRNA (guanosine(2251)-2'-O)-methyltransferase RlmB [Flavobacteriales bacterium]|nr:23S rRNA (guanosine(2251)-2'-O)-methyltransferase RlmB [Flavobacteriales bacterium]